MLLLKAFSSIPSFWSRSACGSSWGPWGGMLIKINSAGLLRFLLLTAPSGDGELAVERWRVTGKLNKQWCLFITRRRSDKETWWELKTCLMLWQTGVMEACFYLCTWKEPHLSKALFFHTKNTEGEARSKQGTRGPYLAPDSNISSLQQQKEVFSPFWLLLTVIWNISCTTIPHCLLTGQTQKLL